jgi:hypothetical protein
MDRSRADSCFLLGCDGRQRLPPYDLSSSIPGISRAPNFAPASTGPRCSSATSPREGCDRGLAGARVSGTLAPTGRCRSFDDFRILGPLEALDEGRDVAPAGNKQRALLALLLLHANEMLPVDRLRAHPSPASRLSPPPTTLNSPWRGPCDARHPARRATQAALLGPPSPAGVRRMQAPPSLARARLRWTKAVLESVP